jgi:hypothetical protein
MSRDQRGGHQQQQASQDLVQGRGSASEWPGTRRPQGPTRLPASRLTATNQWEASAVAGTATSRAGSASAPRPEVIAFVEDHRLQGCESKQRD